ncbi:MAG: ribbon-helix-helix domain-containing protein, partial [Alphaproteobacteria bacterium]|nr:ribbon-helix-helix domain-containing protein [Alphaproteobacteria bacterium]
MNSPIDYINRNPLKKIKKNVYIEGRRTSMSFEDYIWEQLERLGHEENMTVDEICTEIERARPNNRII